MLKYCVIGEKLTHTLSPQIHREFFRLTNTQGQYDTKEISREDIRYCRDFLLSYDGVNVTIPHKLAVMDNLDFISDEAKHIGAVNTVKKDGDMLYGYNSDPYGFGQMLLSRDIEVDSKSAYVLGYGGACKSVIYYLKSKKAKVTVVSRSPEKVDVNDVESISYDELYSRAKSGLSEYVLINCTPVGMFPEVNNSPVDESVIACFDVVADIVYNPVYTQFLKIAAGLGKRVVGGFYMLVAQAMRSQSIWTDKNIGDDITKAIFDKLIKGIMKKNNSNIYLTGVMSCGKSTLGKMLAESIGKRFIDLDEYIVKSTGKTIQELFEQGEEVFRQAESKALYEVSLLRNTVVATGGGCILKDNNIDLMRLSGYTVFVKRDIDNIAKFADCSTRPLLKEGVQKLRDIYNVREKRYHDTAQEILLNNGSRKQGLDDLKDLLNR